VEVEGPDTKTDEGNAAEDFRLIVFDSSNDRFSGTPKKVSQHRHRPEQSAYITQKDKCSGGGTPISATKDATVRSS